MANTCDFMVSGSIYENEIDQLNENMEKGFERLGVGPWRGFVSLTDRGDSGGPVWGRMDCYSFATKMSYGNEVIDVVVDAFKSVDFTSKESVALHVDADENPILSRVVLARK